MKVELRAVLEVDIEEIMEMVEDDKVDKDAIIAEMLNEGAIKLELVSYKATGEDIDEELLEEISGSELKEILQEVKDLL